MENFYNVTLLLLGQNLKTTDTGLGRKYMISWERTSGHISSTETEVPTPFPTDEAILIQYTVFV